MTRIWGVQFPIFGPMNFHSDLSAAELRSTLGITNFSWMNGRVFVRWKDQLKIPSEFPNAICLISMISPRNAWFHPMWLGYLSAEWWVPSDNQSHGLGSYAKAQSVRFNFPSYQPPIPAMFDDTSCFCLKHFNAFLYHHGKPQLYHHEKTPNNPLILVVLSVKSP